MFCSTLIIIFLVIAIYLPFYNALMSFFAKGDFKLQDSWQQKPPSRISNSRQKQREKEKNNSLVNAGKNIIAEPSTDILDDQISKRILRDFASQIPPSFSVKTDKKGPSKQDNSIKLPPKQKQSVMPQTQNDLLTSMAARLKTVEMTCKNQRQQIRQKSQQLQKVKAQNTFLKGYRDDATKQYEKMKTMQSENEELKKKVQQMELYLKKYGLKWVGSKIQGKLQHEKMKKDIKGNNYQYRMPSEIDINTIIRRSEELNAGLHSEGMGTQVFHQKGVHKFRKAEPLPMGFFSNGIAIKGYKFFPYKSKESLQILSDLLDGYFPYVLKLKYPNGVFIKVVDKIAEKYNDQASQQTISTFQSNQNKDFKPPSKQQFLNKLPKQIIKNGKIIDIRGQIEKRLNGQADKQIKQQTEQQQNDIYEKHQGIVIFKTKYNIKLQERQINQTDICTLKIRNEQGDVFILHLQKQSTVKQIYSWMRKVTPKQFKLMGNFPRRAYETQQSENLQDLGFYPNAMLHIQTVPSK